MLFKRRLAARVRVSIERGLSLKGSTEAKARGTWGIPFPRGDNHLGVCTRQVARSTTPCPSHRSFTSPLTLRILVYFPSRWPNQPPQCLPRVLLRPLAVRARSASCSRLAPQAPPSISWSTPTRPIRIPRSLSQRSSGRRGAVSHNGYFYP